MSGQERRAGFDGVERALGRMEGKMDTTITILEKFDGRISENEKEINKSKVRSAWYSGAAATLAFIAGKLVDVGKLF